jgi:hypothetical protein
MSNVLWKRFCFVEIVVSYLFRWSLSSDLIPSFLLTWQGYSHFSLTITPTGQFDDDVERALKGEYPQSVWRCSSVSICFGSVALSALLWSFACMDELHFLLFVLSVSS